MKSSVAFKVSLVYTLFCVSVPPLREKEETTCSREQSSVVRQILHKIWRPIFVEHGVKLPKECPLHFSRDIFKYQELAKLHYRVNLWTCGFCGKSFFKETHLDHHIAHRHSHRVLKGDETVCLADYCDVFRCQGFELERGEDSLLLFNDTQEKAYRNAPKNALVLGPPHELAVLLSAGERERHSEAYLGLGTWDPLVVKKRKPDKTEEDESVVKKAPRGGVPQDSTKKRRASVMENLDEREPSTYLSTQESLFHWFFHPEVKNDECDTEAMQEMHAKCQNLIHDCISPLLSGLSSDEYKLISQYLDRRICWYLTCDRYWQFMGSKRPGSSFGLLILLGSSLLAFIALSYYIVWFCF